MKISGRCFKHDVRTFGLHQLVWLLPSLTILLGNLGTIQLVYQKLQELGAAGTFSWDTTISIFQRWTWAIQGFMLTLKGTSLPIGPGDWYWNPSRVIPPRGGNEITEFPLFTFIYSDLHAHMIAIPLALLALSWALAVVAGRAKWRNRWSAALWTRRGRSHHRRVLSRQPIRYLYLFADRHHCNWIRRLSLCRDIIPH